MIKSMMKWRVKKESGYSSLDQEDVRKSLEILDNVLAEYDDTEEPWSHFAAKDTSWREENGSLHNGVEDEEECIRQRLPVASCDNYEESYDDDGRQNQPLQTFSSFSDGSTSQLSTWEQLRKFRGPPVPKRNPATRLSSHEDLLHLDMESLMQKDKSWSMMSLDNPSISGEPPIGHRAHHNNSLSRRKPAHGSPISLPNADKDLRSLSNQRSITKYKAIEASPKHISYASSNDEVSFESIQSDSGSYRCASSGSVSPPFSFPTDMEKSPSVAERLAEFEMKNKAEPRSPKPEFGSVSLPTDSTGPCRPVTNSPFLKRKTSKMKSSGVFDFQTDGMVAQETRMRNSSSESKNSFVLAEQSEESFEYSASNGNCSSNSPKLLELIERSNSVESSTSPEKSPRSPASKACKFEMELENEVAKKCPTEEKIRRLDEKFAVVKQLLKTNQISVLKSEPPNFTPNPPPKPPRKYPKQKTTKSTAHHTTNTYAHAQTPKKAIHKTELSLSCAELSNRINDSDISNYSLYNGRGLKNIQKTPLSNTIEDIPKLLPTDTLNRPQLGLSYTMEDDLSPGIKEISTSTPKSDKSIKSTFNESFSSLGYGSSQSDLDLNLSPKDGDKIPIVNLKSQTLPTGSRLTPEFYRAADIETDCDSLDSYKPKESVEVSGEESTHFRSSSAPPFKHLENADKKNRIFGMNIKDKTKQKNEYNVSLKFEPSLQTEKGVILRRIGTFQNSSNEHGPKVSAGPGIVTEEKKRRSVWKSILRRK